jgi:hypothetical protein
MRGGLIGFVLAFAAFLPLGMASAFAATPAATTPAFASCEGKPNVTDVSTDARLRQRIIDIAVGEWRQFGFQVLDVSTPESAANLSPLLGFALPQAQIPERLRGMPGGRLLRIGFPEDDEEASLRRQMREYWRTLYDDAGAKAVSLTATPWSAAFVSWVMCRAGLSPDQFTRSEGHVFYVAAAFRNEEANGLSALNSYAYYVRPFADAPVLPGDLVCFSGEDLTYEDRRTISLERRWSGRDDTHSHCDIVVGFAGNGARVLAIGGNVQNGVSLSVFAARRMGNDTFLVGRTDATPFARPFYGVMHLRARPDLAGTASVSRTLQIQ